MNNMPPLFAALRGAGKISRSELRGRADDGQPIIDLAECYDELEILVVESENQRRARRAAERKK